MFIVKRKQPAETTKTTAQKRKQQNTENQWETKKNNVSQLRIQQHISTALTHKYVWNIKG